MAYETKKQIIIFDRVELYKDFIINLIYYIFTYYIDDNSFDDEDIDKFYHWCFNKVCDEFKEEGVDFSQNEKLEKYFKDYFFKNYFYVDEAEKGKIKFHIAFWDNIFNIDNLENTRLLSAFVELYTIFDESINNKTKEGVLIKE